MSLWAKFVPNGKELMRWALESHRDRERTYSEIHEDRRKLNQGPEIVGADERRALDKAARRIGEILREYRP